MSRHLDGKVAFVTGAGRPRGIGRATTVELAKAGADVVVTDIARPGPRIADLPIVAEDDSGLREAVSEITSLGRRSIAIPLDVTIEEEVIAAVDAAGAAFGGVDILFTKPAPRSGSSPSWI